MAHKLSVTIGDNKIEYEGDAGEVAQRFDRLTEMLVRARTNGHAGEAETPSPRPQEEPRPQERRDHAHPEEPPAAKEDDSFPALDREPAYSRRDLAPLLTFDGTTPRLSSPDRPSDPAARVLLVFYGFWALNGDRYVGAPAMGKALRASGDERQRLDRLLSEHQSLYLTRGQYRGKRYALTAEGVDYCEEIILNELGGRN